MLYDIIIFCGFKCGGVTLSKTFEKNNYNTLHLHSFEHKGMFSYQLKLIDIKDTINDSVKNKDIIYIIDSYRNPIERIISAFFQNIQLILPNYNELSINNIIDYFNNNYLNNKNNYFNYNPINQIMTYYDAPLFKNFDFEKRYNILKKDNKVFIKILFKDIQKWDKILSEIFEKDIILHSDNLTINKDINILYEKFKDAYKVPKEYLTFIENGNEFKIYNTPEDQKTYLDYWKNKSF
jgi:hypothetical protein